jgi:para-nitrobenzyl esterase
MSNCLAFRNIRYAKAQRFAAAEIVPFDGAEAGGRRGPLPPQNPSRYELVLGSQAPLAQSEDCQILSVFTPAVSGKRPVMLWFHGGAHITGGGQLPWYDGDRLAAEQDLVVVSVSARLGALGYLQLENPDGPSPAITDQMAAIEWVHRHIDRFGGDPDHLTLFGQSAGAFSIEVLLRWGLGKHVTGAIMQSGFMNKGALSYKRADVGEQSDRFKKLVGRDLRSVAVAELLEKQQEFARQAGTALVWAPVRPTKERGIEIPVIAGWTRDEMFSYILIEEGRMRPEPGDLAVYAEEIARQNTTVIDSCYFVANDAVKTGSKSWLYQFNWDVPQSNWGAVHCIELPFLLGGREAWQAAPMLKGGDWKLLDQRGKHMRAMWASFARNGDPGEDWIEYQQTDKVVNRPFG